METKGENQLEIFLQETDKYIRGRLIASSAEPPIARLGRRVENGTQWAQERVLASISVAGVEDLCKSNIYTSNFQLWTHSKNRFRSTLKYDPQLRSSLHNFKF